ncbi:MAG: hypothetical protein M3186_11615, partial [Actinomycetota bacterium]|nr:hypothetical protein [Actinomycetota bacterium]
LMVWRIPLRLSPKIEDAAIVVVTHPHRTSLGRTLIEAGVALREGWRCCGVEGNVAAARMGDQK